jgi:uncharacterized membrane protein YczE
VPPLPGVPRTRRLRRLTQLVIGLLLFGMSMGFMVRANLGLGPWDVFHQGLSNRVPLSYGVITMLVGAVVLLLWIPLRERPGLGTVLNVIVVGLAVDATLALLSEPSTLLARATMLGGGIVLNGFATGCYIGAGLGAGPRDGLMTGLSRRTGRSIRFVATCIQLTVLATGWLLGGTVGIGTVLFAVAIGPLVHVFLPRLTIRAAG